MESSDHTYPQIDEALAPVADFVQELVGISGEMVNKDHGMRMYVESLDISTPIEMDVLVSENGEVVLGSAPPTQTVETSFMPVFHQIKLNISIEENGK